MRLSEVAESPHFREQAALAEPSRVPPVGVEGVDRALLARRVEDPSVPLPQRLAAGAVLAVAGDPRLAGTAPATCFVAGGRTSVGLPSDRVAEVVRRWEHVGVVADWIEKETPEHPVELDDFWIGAYPVTNGEYRDFLADTEGARGPEEAAGRPSTWYLGAYPWERSNHPVAGVRPEDADRYAAWLSERTGHPWRLPTEAEWEHAARGEEGREFPWGAEFDVDACNTRESGIHTTTPVGAFPTGAAPCGAYDMGGNVEEFVADDYVPYPSGPYVADHLVETMGGYRVARGGGFSRFGDLARTRRRHGPFPGPLYPVGFRLATSERPS